MREYGLKVTATGDLPTSSIVTVTLWNPELEKGRVFDCRAPQQREAIHKILKDPEREFVTFYGQKDLYYILKDLGVRPNLVGDVSTLAFMKQKTAKPEKLTDRYSYLMDLTEGSYSIDVKLTEKQCEDEMEIAHLSHELERTMLKSFEQYGNIYALEISLVSVLVEMRYKGLTLDEGRYKHEIYYMEQELRKLRKELYDEAKCEFSLTSRKELKDILFDQMKLKEPPVKTAAGNLSLSAEALSYLEHIPFIGKLIDARHLESVLGSTKDVKNNLVGGRLHPEFRPIGESGSARIYSTKPSVNQMPVELRRAIYPEEGHKFWYIDWKGAELIYLAIQAGQQNLIDFYYAGGDVHAFVSSEILGVPIEKITEEKREVSKVVTFSIVFGSKGEAASKKLRVKRETAEKWVKVFFLKFTDIKRFMDKSIITAKSTGKSETWLGRRRILNKLRHKSGDVVREGERQAMNTPIQNGVADLMKWAMIKIHKRLRGEVDLKFVVFDSFLLQVPNEYKIEEYKAEFDSAFTFSKGNRSVRFLYDVKEGTSWGELMV